MIPLTYSAYLRLDELLSLQQVRVPAELSRRVAASENFFIIAHQSSELWLSQVLLDLDAAREQLVGDGGELEVVVEHLQRVTAIMAVLEEQVTVLNKLSVACFAVFRTYLGTASGAQSPHFRELDRMLGAGRGSSPIGEAFDSAIHAAGLDPVALWRDDLRAGSLLRIANGLLDIGQAYWKWKSSHLSLVARVLGTGEGTGGTTGIAHLIRGVTMPFPELREAQRRAYFGPVEESRPPTPAGTGPGGFRRMA